MNEVSYSAASADLGRLMDKVCNDHAPVVVTRDNARSVVLLSLADYRALEETAYLLRCPGNAERLARSIADIEAGLVKERGLLE